MLIDWWTVIAQIVNFVVLVLLLKWLLYGRIIRAMDERQAKMVEQMEQAEKARKNAEQEADSLQKKTAELDAKRKQLLDEAAGDAERARKEMLARARGKVDESTERWKAMVRERQRHLVDDLRRLAGEGVCRVASRALSDLADAQLGRQIVSAFLSRLEQIDDDGRRALAEAMREAEGRLVVHSAPELPEEDREKVTGAVRHTLGEDIEVSFETSKSLICGIELRAAGRAIGWSLSEYLDTLSETIAESIRERTASVGAGPPADGVEDADGKPGKGAGDMSSSTETSEPSDGK